MTWAWRIARSTLKSGKSFSLWASGSFSERVFLSNTCATDKIRPCHWITEYLVQLGSLILYISSFIEIAHCILIMCWLYFNLWFKVVLPGNQSLQYAGLISRMLEYSTHKAKFKGFINILHYFCICLVMHITRFLFSICISDMRCKGYKLSYRNTAVSSAFQK